MPQIVLELSEEGMGCLEDLVKKSNVLVGTKREKDVVNFALTILEWALTELMAGNTIAVVDERNKKYKALDLRFAAKK